MITTSFLDTAHSLAVQLGTVQQRVLSVSLPCDRLIDGFFKSIITLIELLASFGIGLCVRLLSV
ncbi:hypothetical protein D3C76_1149890 [compost metagenome]